MSSIDQQTPTATSWAIDSAHSNVEFSVRHMMISTVKGMFQAVEGSIEWDGQNLESATVHAKIDATTVTTFNETRDNHLRTNDFFNAEQWPHLVFESSKVEPQGNEKFKIHGTLTIRDVTKPVVLDTEFLGTMEKDAFGMRRAAFEATTEINRKDFGVNWNGAIESGGVVVGDMVKVTLNIAVVQEG